MIKYHESRRVSKPSYHYLSQCTAPFFPQDGSTLMHIAALNGHPETAHMLFKKGVPLLMPNKVCSTSRKKLELKFDDFYQLIKFFVEFVVVVGNLVLDLLQLWSGSLTQKL